MHSVQSSRRARANLGDHELHVPNRDRHRLWRVFSVRVLNPQGVGRSRCEAYRKRVLSLTAFCSPNDLNEFWRRAGCATNRSPSRAYKGVFPSPTDPTEPVSRHLLRDWWRDLERLAGLPVSPGRGWHSLRRKFATECKDLPLKDLMALGGWSDPQTLLRYYMQSDPITMRQALSLRGRLRAEGLVRNTVTDTPMDTTTDTPPAQPKTPSPT